MNDSNMVRVNRLAGVKVGDDNSELDPIDLEEKAGQ